MIEYYSGKEGRWIKTDVIFEQIKNDLVYLFDIEFFDYYENLSDYKCYRVRKEL
jgi:hypothetical protein